MLLQLYSDRSFIYGSYQSAVIHSMKGHKPIWFYSFEYKGLNTYGDLFAGTTDNIDFDWGKLHRDEVKQLETTPQKRRSLLIRVTSVCSLDIVPGVSHCDDLLYLFNSPALIPPLVAQIDVYVSNLMVELWTNFAIYG